MSADGKVKCSKCENMHYPNSTGVCKHCRKTTCKVCGREFTPNKKATRCDLHQNKTKVTDEAIYSAF